jgi:hypothetical protein
MARLATLLLMSMVFVLNAAADSQIVYLSCNIGGDDGHAATHFDFTLDEQNSTVTYYVEAAAKTNKEKAVFGPKTVTWSEDGLYGVTLTRTIDRTSLVFTQDLIIAGNKSHSAGQCSLVKSPERKF